VFQQKDAELLQQKADEQRRAAEQRWLHDNFTQDGETGTHTLPTVANSHRHTLVSGGMLPPLAQQSHTHATHELNRTTNCHHCCTHVPPPLVNITIHTHTHTPPAHQKLPWLHTQSLLLLTHLVPTGPAV